MGNDERSPSAARAQTRAALQAAQWSPGQIEDACLVISELVTNALLHGGGVARVSLDLDDEQLRILIGDHNNHRLHRGMLRSTAPSGRGLLILDALCQAWGIQIIDNGVICKQVWAIIARDL